MTGFRPSLPPESSSTTRIRSGRRSTLVPSSAWAVRAADVRLRKTANGAPMPAPDSPRRRKSSRQHERFIRHLGLLAELIFRRAEHEVQQLSKRRLERDSGLHHGSAKLAAKKVGQHGSI